MTPEEQKAAIRALILDKEAFTSNSVWDVIRSMDIIIDNAGGGGSEAPGESGLFPVTGTGTATGNVIGSLAGNTLSIQQGGNNFLSIDPTAGSETSVLRAFNVTGDDNVASITSRAYDTESVIGLYTAFDGSTKEAYIDLRVDATTSTLDYTAATHTFNVATEFNVLDGGESRLFIDPTNGAPSFLRAFDPTDDDNVAFFRVSATPTEADAAFRASFNGVKEATIQATANASDATFQYTADTHTFNGDMIIAGLAGGGTTGLSIDNDGKIIRTP